MLRAYDWPGNVRQLQNVLRNAIVMHEGTELTPAMLPLPRVTIAPDVMATPAPGFKREIQVVGPVQQSCAIQGGPAQWRGVGDIVSLIDLERAAIERAIDICEGNVPRAAAFLGVSPSTLYRKKQGWEAA